MLEAHRSRKRQTKRAVPSTVQSDPPPGHGTPELPAPEFAFLLVSRPRRVAPIVRRAWGFALAVGLYGAVLLGVLASPVFMLELMRPPEAGVTEPPVPPGRTITLPPQPRIGGDGLLAGPRKKGVNNATERRSEHQRTSAMRHSPAIVPLAEPPSPVDSSQETTGIQDDSPGTEGPPGDPLGEDGGGDRSGPGSDCPRCIGTGPAGPGDDGPFGPSTPGLVLPRIIPSSRALPQYPPAARRAGLLGTVILMVVIEADGSVGEIQVLRSPDQRWGFDLSAIDAVKQWRYEPALMNGRAVAAYITVMVEFTLSR